jgi:SLT domain-containing protein
MKNISREYSLKRRISNWIGGAIEVHASQGIEKRLRETFRIWELGHDPPD